MFILAGDENPDFEETVGIGQWLSPHRMSKIDHCGRIRRILGGQDRWPTLRVDAGDRIEGYRLVGACWPVRQAQGPERVEGQAIRGGIRGRAPDFARKPRRGGAGKQTPAICIGTTQPP
jgi:hypothetical protein